MAIQFNIGGTIKQPSKIQICVDGVIKSATKVQANIGGVIKTVWSAGTRLGDLPLMSIIKIEENGVPQDFYVVRHNAYASERTLLLRRYISHEGRWHMFTVNAYAASTLDSWFNGTYLNGLPADIQGQIAEVTIPYTPGNGDNALNSLSRKVFALSATELGYATGFMNVEGTALQHASTLKVARDSAGNTKHQWTRSPHTGNTSTVWLSRNDGAANTNYPTDDMGIRPAFTLPSNYIVPESQPLKWLNVGDKIKFGNYSVNGEAAQSIIWRVVAKKPCRVSIRSSHVTN